MEAQDKSITIKKYENRKFYVTKKYISLFDIRDYIREGYDVNVVKFPGAEDCTDEVLDQLIRKLQPTRFMSKENKIKFIKNCDTQKDTIQVNVLCDRVNNLPLPEGGPDGSQ